MKGLVIKNTGSWYTVRTDNGETVESKIKGNFRLKGIRSTNPVAVGDRVEIALNQEGTAFITAIEDRRNYIVRKSQNLSKQSHIIAASVDQAFLIVTVSHPQTSTTFIDRFLASAEAYSVPVVLVFNKTDLLSPEELHYQAMMVSLYETVGYGCRQISAATGEGVAPLIDLLQGKVTVFSGNMPLCLEPSCVPPRFPMPTTPACTPPPSARCCSWPMADISSTRPAYAALAPSIWSPKKYPATSRKSSASPRIAGSPTAPTPTNPVVLCLMR